MKNHAWVGVFFHSPMRDDGVAAQKRVKQQIIALCTRNGKLYEGKNYWTKKHLDWLHGLEFDHPILKEALQEYLVLYYTLTEKVDRYSIRIEELSHMPNMEQVEHTVGVDADRASFRRWVRLVADRVNETCFGRRLHAQCPRLTAFAALISSD